MLGYPVSTVADIAADPQLEARGFFETAGGVGGTHEVHCGAFVVIDGQRPPLRHVGGSPAAAATARLEAGARP
jgi:benzylsuccinate CoA-transferase BbsE subunit